LYQKVPSSTTNDALLEPLLDGFGQVHGLSTQVDPGQAVPAFEILNDVTVVGGSADLRNAEKADQFVFRHNGRTGAEFTLWTWQNGRRFRVLLCAVHGCSPGRFFAGYRPEKARISGEK
jgi:hypothetical protein